MKELVEKSIAVNELVYKDVLRKQRSINRLFPTFNKRVTDVANKGGIRLAETRPGLWRFRVKSASIKDHWYDVYVHWKTLEASIKKHAADRRLWNKDKTEVDYRKLAVEVLFDTDVEINCSCPADLYWGGQYIRTQKSAKYTEPENRAPHVRNPKQYGAMCKHLQLVFDLLPHYGQTMASYLKKHYKKLIKETEKATVKQAGMVKKVAKTLKKREKATQAKAKADLIRKGVDPDKKEVAKEEPKPKAEEPKKDKPEPQRKPKDKKDDRAKKEDDEQQPEEDEQKKKRDTEDDEETDKDANESIGREVRDLCRLFS